MPSNLQVNWTDGNEFRQYSLSTWYVSKVLMMNTFARSTFMWRIYIYTTLQGLYIDMNSLPSLIGFWGRLPFSRLAEVKLIFAEHLRLGGTPKIRDDDGMTDGI